MSAINEELNSKQFVGEVHDSIKFVQEGSVILGDGTEIKGKTGEVVDLPVSFNLVVDSFSTLIATLVKGDTRYFNNLYWEVGSGTSSWNDATPPTPVATDNKLLTPLFRKKINASDISFITEFGAITSDVTNRLQVSMVFATGEANGALREFGIFAGGSTTLGSGIMINRKTHGLIFKSSGIELHRKIHFKF